VSDDVANTDADADSAASVNAPVSPSLLDSVTAPPNNAQPDDVQTDDTSDDDPPQLQLAFTKHDSVMMTAIANIIAPIGDTLTTTAIPMLAHLMAFAEQSFTRSHEESCKDAIRAHSTILEHLNDITGRLDTVKDKHKLLRGLLTLTLVAIDKKADSAEITCLDE
jgi:hypothetical protein